MGGGKWAGSRGAGQEVGVGQRETTLQSSERLDLPSLRSSSVPAASSASFQGSAIRPPGRDPGKAGRAAAQACGALPLVGDRDVEGAGRHVRAVLRRRGRS